MAVRKRDVAGGEVPRLDKRLDDYSVLTRVSATAGRLRGRSGKWPVYAAAAGSALAMATNASANIIYCGSVDSYCSINPHPLLTATFNGPNSNADKLISIPLPVTYRTSHKVILRADTGLLGFTSGAGTLLESHVRIFDASALNAKNFVAGALIGPGLANAQWLGTGVVANASASGTLGNFIPGQSGFAGLEILSVGSALDKHTDYGWIRLVFSDGSGFVNPTLTAIDWAVEETPGMSIEAGQEADLTPTPEPGTLPLALLVSGAAGVLALRRRYQGMKNPAADAQN